MSVRYNPPQRMILRTRLLIVAAVLAILLPASRAANWGQPVEALARKIAVLAGHGQVRLSVANRSSLEPDEVARIGEHLKRDLQALGVSEGSADSATQVSVTLSENQRGGLWVAQVGAGVAERVVMLPVKLTRSVAIPVSASISLQHRVVMTEPGEVLDAQVIPDGNTTLLVVLEAKQILVYQRGSVPQPFSNVTGTVSDSGQWNLMQAFTIPDKRAFPRDMRGRIAAGQQHLFDAYLPGMTCSASGGGMGVQIACANSDDPWPIAGTQKAFYDPSRDYFMGVLVPGFHVQPGPFYDAAEIPRTGGPELALTNIDGTASLVENGMDEPLGGTEEWGSDLTAIPSACGDGELLVVSGAGPADTEDNLRAYEIASSGAIAVSPPLEVAGTVTAIWPSQNGNDATVVVRKPENAGYEVWSVTANCH